MSFQLHLTLFSVVFVVVNSDGDCRDLSIDCRLIAVKCLSPNRVEQKLMEIACSKTCGYCVDTSRRLTSSRRCADLMNDCAGRVEFCTKRTYKRMMSIQCSKTCNYCSSEDYDDDADDSGDENSSEKSSRETHLENLKQKIGPETFRKLESLNIIDNLIPLVRTSTPAEVSLNCFDKARDCARTSKLCFSTSYKHIFQKLCAKTCNFCEFTENDLIYDSPWNSEDFEISIFDYVR